MARRVGGEWGVGCVMGSGDGRRVLEIGFQSNCPRICINVPPHAEALVGRTIEENEPKSFLRGHGTRNIVGNIDDMRFKGVGRENEREQENKRAKEEEEEEKREEEEEEKREEEEEEEKREEEEEEEKREEEEEEEKREEEEDDDDEEEEKRNRKRKRKKKKELRSLARSTSSVASHISE
ncbi:hypothetical protein V1478_004157 [Vespula squamosa]|uniref:Uncharacterized protein n=1 Tax=Vespula squamosa TaxID=30214 RepID=A0ABD2BPE9_VESSQ